MTNDKSAPMDPNAREGETPGMYKPTDRNTYAMDTLIEEVLTLFPETTFEVGNRNPRGVAFDVTFAPSEDLRSLLVLIDSDGRLRDIFASADGVTVSFRNNPVIMDDRTPFRLDTAWAILNGEES